MISQANIVKFHFQLPSSLILWSCQKKINYAMYCKHGGLRRQRTEDQAFVSLHLQADPIRKSFNTNEVSLNS